MMNLDYWSWTALPWTYFLWAQIGWANFLAVGAVVMLGVCIALAVVSARIDVPVLGALATAPVVIGLLARALGLGLLNWADPTIASLLAVELFALGVAAGGPLTLFVVGMAEAHSVRAGSHGGIVPRDVREPDEGQHEVLRGGATIGYLERIAVIGCLVVGRVEGIAVVVAIKGLGRFSELDSPEARERFIIGTLVSLIWACATGALLMFTVNAAVQVF